MLSRQKDNEHGFEQVHLRQQLPASCINGLSNETVVSIKQVWKYIYPDMIADRVNLEYQSDETNFIAEIQTEWSDETQELECTPLLCPREYATRAKNIHVYNMGVYSREGIKGDTYSIQLINWTALLS